MGLVSVSKVISLKKIAVGLFSMGGGESDTSEHALQSCARQAAVGPDMAQFAADLDG